MPTVLACGRPIWRLGGNPADYFAGHPPEAMQPSAGRRPRPASKGEFQRTTATGSSTELRTETISGWRLAGPSASRVHRQHGVRKREANAGDGRTQSTGAGSRSGHRSAAADRARARARARALVRAALLLRRLGCHTVRRRRVHARGRAALHADGAAPAGGEHAAHARGRRQPPAHLRKPLPRRRLLRSVLTQRDR